MFGEALFSSIFSSVFSSVSLIFLSPRLSFFLSPRLSRLQPPAVKKPLENGRTEGRFFIFVSDFQHGNDFCMRHGKWGVCGEDDIRKGEYGGDGDKR